MRYRAQYLGTPELFADDVAVVFPFKKAQVLALILIMEKNLTKDKICEYLWSDKSSEKARRNLSNALSCIKKFLPVNVGSGSVSLDLQFTVECDIDLINHTESISWQQINELTKTFMDSAEIDDWGGLCGWLLPKRQYYHDQLVKGLRRRAQLQLSGCAKDRSEDALHCYEILSELEPYDEKIHGELVRLYIKTKQRLKAINTARSFSERIEHDLGVHVDLSEVSSLMKRKTEGPIIRASRTLQETGNPIERSSDIMKMLDFFTSGTNERPLCGMVWGEQGIGKTVFVNDIILKLKENGWECFSVDCWQEEKSYPLAPVMRLLKSLSITPHQQEDIKLMSEVSYSYIADMILNRITESKNLQKQLLVIENLQWLDDASWNILETLMCSASVGANLLVTGYSEIRPAFMLRTVLADEPYDKFELTLARFNLEETGRICHEMAPEEDWSEDKIRDVYMQSEGNPFFIREILKYKPEERNLSNISYKNTYKSMIELLEDNERLFLEAIAVVPECAYMKEIAEVLEITPLAVSKIYNNLRLHGFLREQETGDGDVAYYFTHIKIREALISGMSLSRKAALHSKNIEILEKHMPEQFKYKHKKLCERIAYHAHASAMPKKELYWRIREMELHLMAVHEVFPTLVDQDLMHYIPSAEDADYTQKALCECVEILNKLLRSEGGSRELLCMERDLYTLRGGYLWWSGKYDDSYQMLREAVRKGILAGAPEPIIRAGVQMCYLAIQRDDAKHLAFVANKLRRFASKYSFKQWEGIAYRFLGISSILSGHSDAAEKYLLSSTMIFEKLEDRGENYTACLIAAEHFRGDMFFARNDFEKALSYYKNCINIGESAALFRGLGLSLAKAALCCVILDRYDESEKLLQRMGKFYNLMHTNWEDGLQGGGIAFSIMALVNCHKKDWQKTSMCYAAAERLVRASRRPVWQAVLCWSKLKLFDVEAEMPQGFKDTILTHPKDWYAAEFAKLKEKIGWIDKK